MPTAGAPKKPSGQRGKKDAKKLRKANPIKENGPQTQKGGG